MTVVARSSSLEAPFPMTVVRACRGTTAPFDAVAGPLQEG